MQKGPRMKLYKNILKIDEHRTNKSRALGEMESVSAVMLGPGSKGPLISRDIDCIFGAFSGIVQPLFVLVFGRALLFLFL